MSTLAVIAFALSAAFILAIALGDPKRRRAAQQSGEGHSPAQRRLLTFCVLLPGFICIVRGDPSAFLIWLGGCAVMGWITAVAFSRPVAADRGRKG
ncbi:hypothetical protein BH11PSE5_BH11PSE5_29180 [soil metagenome]|tara:strand:+ start:1414 stop:1701 length:288 start_codon:yes stop_codon:yes gene_type:complete